MRLHILTACSRPANLPRLADNVASIGCEPWEVCWHLRFDLAREHVGGHKLKNDMLDQITDGWVLFLDDDTLLHPDIALVAARHRHADAVVVSQLRTTGQVLHAARENIRVGRVDIGQAVISRELIGDARLPTVYVGDGLFLTAVLGLAPHVHFVDEVLSYHNALDKVAA